MRNLIAKEEPASSRSVASIKFDQQGSRTMYRYANIDRYWCPVVATGTLTFIADMIASRPSELSLSVAQPVLIDPGTRAAALPGQ
jgi:hypothetical protein